MAVGRAGKKRMAPFTARIMAVCFFAAGLALGGFAAPRYVDGLLDKAGAREWIPWRLSESKFVLPWRLGLDIQGGTHLVYAADLSGIGDASESESMEALRDVIERRVNLFGVAEPLVQIERAGGDWRLIVELAGVGDVNTAIKMIGQTPYLEFREERPEEERLRILEAQQKGEAVFQDPLFAPTPLNGRHIKRASVVFDQTAFQPQISLELTSQGADLFAELTHKNVGKRLAIYLDGAPISAPLVQEEITGGKAQITGNFTPESARELAGRMNAGALPVPITLSAQQTVGPSLGEESLAKSLYAGMIGLFAVALFMVAWYRLPGAVAVAALLLYIVVLLGIFKLIPVTLTISGIAGVILSVGMAVDANILIFERMKEEIMRGSSLEEAVSEGFSRAWTSIRDSNVSSLITSAILYWFGTSMVQGFALTLGIGILVSMFSAIMVTRTLLFALMSQRLMKVRAVFLSGIAR